MLGDEAGSNVEANTSSAIHGANDQLLANANAGCIRHKRIRAVTAEVATNAESTDAIALLQLGTRSRSKLLVVSVREDQVRSGCS